MKHLIFLPLLLLMACGNNPQFIQQAQTAYDPCQGLTGRWGAYSDQAVLLDVIDFVAVQGLCNAQSVRFGMFIYNGGGALFPTGTLVLPIAGANRYYRRFP